MRFYLTYKNHGLYDPVLDDTEVIYVPVDPEELGIVNIQSNVQQQQKTEIIESCQTDSTTLVTPVDKLHLEPNLECLPLLVSLHEIPPEGQFKLPISEQYDPEGKRVRLCKINGKKVVRFDLSQIGGKNEERAKLEKAQDDIRNFINESKLKQDIREDSSTFVRREKETDLSVIKERAIEIVSDSIEKAISFAKEAKENVKNELISEQNNLIESNTKEILNNFEKKFKEVNIRKDSMKEEYDVNVSEEVKKFEKINSQSGSGSVEERKLRTKQDIYETIESGTVSRRSEIFTKDNIEVYKPVQINKKCDVISKIYKKDDHSKVSNEERRVFSIGLQTIPNIKEKVNTIQVDSRLKLLTTFFLQLTNVMVALYRIILTQPITYITENSIIQTKEEAKKSEIVKGNKNWENYNHEEGQGLSKYKYEYDSHVSEGELIRKGKLSGAKIAQIEGGKPSQLTDRMDVVISEFQKKVGYEQQSHEEFDQFFRSRSGSSTKMKDEDSFYSGSQRKVETAKKNHEEFSETKTQLYELREITSEKRTFQSTSKTESKPYVYETTVDGKNLTYVAIVEAHVYTNKDAIFEAEMKRDIKMKSEKSTVEKELLNSVDSIVIPETEEKSLKEINDAIIKSRKVETSIEDSIIKVAAKKISEVIEPLVQLIADRSYSIKKVRTSVEPFKSIIQNSDVSTEEFQQYFVATAVVSQKIYPSMEESIKSAVEITEITTDENENQDVQVTELFEKKPVVKIEDARSVAETSEILLKEDEILVSQNIPHSDKLREVVEDMTKIVAETTEVITGGNVETLNTQEQIDKKPHVSIEHTFKTTAETITTLPEENKSDLVEGIQIKPESAKVEIDEMVASEVSEVSVEEPFKEMTTVEVIPRKSHTFLEDTFLPIAEQTTISIQEPKQVTLPLLKPLIEQAKVDINKNVATEIFEASVIDQKEESFAMPKVRIERPKLSIEESAYSVAQNSIISSIDLETNIDIFKATEKIADTKFRELKAIESTVVNFQEPKHDIFETPETIEKYSLPAMEDSHLVVAEKLLTEPEGVIENISDTLFITEQANIEIQNFDAAQMGVVVAEELISDMVEMPTIKEKQPIIEVEKTYLTLAETFTIEPEESKELIEKSLTKTQQVRIAIDEQEAFETTVISLAELQSQRLEIPEIIKKEPQITMTSAPLTVAEIITVLPAEPNDDIFDVPKIAECNPSVNIVQTRAIETVMVRPEEPNSKNLEVIKMEEKQSNRTIEESTLTLAEVLSIFPEERMGKLDIPDAKGQLAKIKILDLKAAEATIVEPEESTLKEIPLKEPTGIQTNPSIERPTLIVAEVTSMLPEETKGELYIPEFKTQQAAVKILELKAADSIVVQTEESRQEFKSEQVKQQQTIPKLESSTLAVAEILTTSLSECSKDIYEVDRIKNRQAHVEVAENKAIETTEVSLGDLRYKKITIPERDSKQIKSTVEEAVQSVAQKTEVHLSEAEMPIPITSKIAAKKASVKFSSVKPLERESITTLEVLEGDIHEKSKVVSNRATLTLVESTAAAVEEYETKQPETNIHIFKTTEKNAETKFSELTAIESTIVNFQEPKHDIFETPETIEKYSLPAMEDSHLVVAEKLLTEPEGVIENISDTLFITEQAKIEIQNFDAAQMGVVVAEELISDMVEMPTIKEKQPIVKVEKTYLTLAETFTIEPEESKELIDKSLTKTQQVRIEIDEQEAFETTIISLAELQSERLEIPEIIKKEPQITMTSAPLTVAEIITVLPAEPNDEIFDVPKIAECNPSVNIVQTRAIETVIVRPEEPNSKNLEVIIMEEKQSDRTIEESTLTLAEVLSIFPEERMGKLDIPDAKGQLAKIKILDLKAPEATVVEPEESTLKEIPLKEPTGIQPNPSIERPTLIVAEVTSILPEETKGELYIPEFKTQQAAVKILELKAADSIVVQTEESKQPKLKTEQLITHYPKPNIEPSNLSVAEVLATSIVESSKSFIIPLISKTDQKILTEGITLSVAETTAVVPSGPKDEPLGILKIEDYKPSIDVVEIKAAETILVQSEEPNILSLEVGKVDEKQSVTTIEGPYLTIAEVGSTLPEEANAEFEVPELTKLQAEVKILELKAADSIVVQTEESKEEFKSEQIKQQKTVSNLEPSTLAVAEILTTTLSECSKDIYEVDRIKNRQAHVEVVENKAIETTEVSLGDLRYKKITIPERDSKQIKSTVEEAVQSVAQKTEVHLSEAEMQIPITSKAAKKASLKFSSIKPLERESITTLEVLEGDIHEKSKVVSNRATLTLVESTATAVEETTTVSEASIEATANEEGKLEKHLKTVMERPSLAVAETNTILPQESKEEFDVKLIKNQKAKIGVSNLKTPETMVISSEEAKELLLKLETHVEKKPKQLMEPSNLSVAQVLATTITEASKNILDVKEVKNQQARLTFAKQKAVETEQIFEDMSSKKLTLVTPETRQIQSKMDESVKLVAQVAEVHVNETEHKILESKDKAKQASLILKTIKPIERESIMTLEGVESDNIQKPTLHINKANVSMIESNATTIQEVVVVAEAKKEDFKFIGSDVQASLAIEKSKKAEAQVKDVNIQEDIRMSKIKYNKEYVKDNELDTNVLQSQETWQKHASQAALKSTEFQASTESIYESETKQQVKKSLRARGSAIEEIDVKIREITKDDEISETVSPTSPLSPITPVIEEYMFSLEAELEHPYVIGVGVSEEALLRIKAQRNEIQSADTSYTLAIESTIESDSEDIEEIENVHLSKIFLAQRQEEKIETARSLKSKASSSMNVISLEDKAREARSLDANQSILIKKQKEMQSESFSSKAINKLQQSDVFESSKSSEINASSMEMFQENLSGDALANYKLSLKKAIVEDGSMISQSQYNIQQSSQLAAGISSEMNISSIETSRDLSTDYGGDDRYKFSLKKAKVENGSMINQFDYQSQESSQLGAGMSSEINISSMQTSHDLSTKAVDHDASYKLSIQQTALVEDQSMSIQDNKSQSLSRRTRKVKSSKSKRSTQEQDSSLQMMAAGSLEASVDGELEYASHSRKDKSSFVSKSLESSAMGILESETYQHVHKDSGSHKAELHIATESTSLDASSESGVRQYSAKVIKDVSNAVSLKEKLTLQTDIEEAITNGFLQSPPLVPPTPITDEYVFRLQSELPEESSFIQRDCSISPDSLHEEIIVNGLVPHYRTIVERRVLYSPPFSTPPTSPEKTKPIYTKPGLKGGSNRLEFTKKEIVEFQRNRSLISEIDQTLKQIEEYKTSVGIIDETMSQVGQKIGSTVLEDQREEYVDKDFVPIYVEELEELIDNAIVKCEAKESEFCEGDYLKITIVGEDNDEGNIITIMTEKDLDRLEIEEVSNDFENIPLERTETLVLDAGLEDSDKTQDIHKDELLLMLCDPIKVGAEGVAKQLESDELGANAHKELRTDNFKDIQTQQNQETIGIHLKLYSELERVKKEKDKSKKIKDMAQRNLADQMIMNIEDMIDVNAPMEQQLQQMRQQLAALSQLPTVIQQTMQRVNDRINIIQREQQKNMQQKSQPVKIKVTKPSLTEEDLAIIKKEEIKKTLDTKMREEKMRKVMVSTKIDQQSRQVTQRSSPRVNEPTTSLGRLQEQSRILSRRKWGHADEVYDEDMIKEALLGQAEVIKGKAIGVNFMKFQKPPPPLDHLKYSEVFKAIQEQ